VLQARWLGSSLLSGERGVARSPRPLGTLRLTLPPPEWSLLREPLALAERGEGDDGANNRDTMLSKAFPEVALTHLETLVT
jgi:hypothetical protein